MFFNLQTNGNTQTAETNYGKLNGNEKKQIEDSLTLPLAPTTNDLNEASKRAGEIEADTALLREISRYQLEAQQAALANLDVRIQHTTQSMKNANQYQHKMSKFAKNSYELNLERTARKANLNAYETHLQDIKVDI